MFDAPAVCPALAEGGPVGRILLDDLIQGGFGVDGVGVELLLSVGVVAYFAVVALARFHKVLAQPRLVVGLVFRLGGQLLAHLLGKISGVYLGLLTQLVSTVGVL